MILSNEAVNAIYSGVVARGITSLSDDDPTDTEYLWAALSDLQDAREALVGIREKLDAYTAGHGSLGAVCRAVITTDAALDAARKAGEK